MIRQIETKLIPVNDIDMGHRRQRPSEEEVDLMANSIRQDGLLTAIGVRASGDAVTLLYGATRLLAVQKLGWSEVAAVLYEGTAEEVAFAEIIENLERRHLDKDERERLTSALVELRTKEIQSESQKELDDDLSHNSPQESKTHPKMKVEGTKRGRPLTAEGEAKKEAAARTGQSLRNVQRATSKKPRQAREPGKTRNAVTPKDAAVSDFNARTMDMVQRTKGQKVERFAATSVQANDLAKLGNFFTDLAILKKSGVVKSTTGFVSQGNDEDPAETARTMGAAHAANDAEDDAHEDESATAEGDDTGVPRQSDMIMDTIPS